MSESLNFDSLVSLCGQTHSAMQQQAARSVNIGLVEWKNKDGKSLKEIETE